MDSFVYTRHTSDCRYKRDRLYRRCNCPKWIEGRHGGERIRKSSGTRLWDEAERFRQKFEDSLSQDRGLPALEIPPTPPNAPTAASEAIAGTSQPRMSPADPFEEEANPSPLVPAASAPPASIRRLPVTSPTASPDTFLPGRQRARVTVMRAVEAYMTDARSRGLQPDTIKKLERLFEKQFLPWSIAEGLEYLDEVDLDALLSFRSTWTEGAVVKAKKQDRIIGFFWESFRRNFISQNPALSMSKIRPKHIPTDYFPRAEFDRILDMTYVYGDPRGGYIPIEDTRARLRTLTLLMRWSGLRIRDAVTLERQRLQGDSLLLYQAKTGQSVYVPLPPYVVDALVSIPDGSRPNPRYFFWSGNGLPKSVVADWQRSYRRLFELADIRKPDGSRKRCHPHMFRDTFAVEMLLAEVPIDQVSTLLGHSSVKVTERHYSPFVRARQLQLQQSVRAAWKIGGSSGNGPGGSPSQCSATARPQRTLEVIHSGRARQRA